MIEINEKYAAEWATFVTITPALSNHERINLIVNNFLHLIHTKQVEYTDEFLREMIKTTAPRPPIRRGE